MLRFIMLLLTRVQRSATWFWSTVRTVLWRIIITKSWVRLERWITFNRLFRGCGWLTITTSSTGTWSSPTFYSTGAKSRLVTSDSPNAWVTAYKCRVYAVAHLPPWPPKYCSTWVTKPYMITSATFGVILLMLFSYLCWCPFNF